MDKKIMLVIAIVVVGFGVMFYDGMVHVGQQTRYSMALTHAASHGGHEDASEHTDTGHEDASEHAETEHEEPAATHPHTQIAPAQPVTEDAHATH